MEKNKKYYSISQAAEKVSLSISTLRYYDYQGILFFVKKDSNGYRIFTDDDIETISFIKELKSCGMSLQKIKDFLIIHENNSSTKETEIDFLNEYEEELLQRIEDDMLSLRILRNRIRTLRHEDT